MPASEDVITRFVMQAMGEKDSHEFMLNETGDRIILKDPTFNISRDKLMKWAKHVGAELTFSRRKVKVDWK